MDSNVITKRIIFEKDPDTQEPLIEAHIYLSHVLTANFHILSFIAVQFLWNCLIESVEHYNSKNGETSGAVLAHCMGLGKTLSLIALVHTLLRVPPDLLPGLQTCLVICPVSTILNWKNEWEMWVPPDAQVHVFELATKINNKFRVDGGVLLIGYSMFRNLVTSFMKRVRSKDTKQLLMQTLLDPGPDIVVCDEGHLLKNEKSGLSKAVSQIKTKKRVVMTGTPLQNSLAEYFTMVNFVKPNLLGTAKEFSNRFINPIRNGQHSNSTATDVNIMKKRAHILFKTLDGSVQPQRRLYAAYLDLRQKGKIKDSDVMAELPNPENTENEDVDYDLVIIEQQSIRAKSNTAPSLNGPGDKCPRNSLFADQQVLYRIWTHPYTLRIHETREARRVSNLAF
ncbi:unnamed protein product [Protopolystoma xenopodis]|uniref:Helicase ATP-binding domain-containing protein n=1 Tax=Protopolystoma xenopodis TaxID=117903 RepID=A0A3S4ZCA0_9PLAT|nr:unnamed protein product [Protopolystoma xenopodis]